jgi:hypothetical protein
LSSCCSEGCEPTAATEAYKMRELKKQTIYVEHKTKSQNGTCERTFLYIINAYICKKKILKYHHFCVQVQEIVTANKEKENTVEENDYMVQVWKTITEYCNFK